MTLHTGDAPQVSQMRTQQESVPRFAPALYSSWPPASAHVPPSGVTTDDSEKAPLMVAPTATLAMA